MVSTFTPNINLEEPGRGDQVGTWDTAVNNTTTVLDLVAGGTATISLNNANVVLSAAQFRCANLIFNSTLTGSVVITFPASFTKSYTIQNRCTGSSAFTVTLNAVAGIQSIACPPGQPFDCINDGINLNFKNFGPPIGGYMDYAGSSVPNWVTQCAPVQPYLNCDGSAVSSATHPVLFGLIGGTTPDFRGRLPAYLNQGTGRLNAVNSIDGNTLFTGGGNEMLMSHSHANSLNDPGHTHGSNGWSNAGGSYHSAGGGDFAWGPETINPAVTGMTITNAAAGAGGSQNVQPTCISGLRLIRAG